MAKSSRPIGVTVIAVLTWIGAVLAVIGGIGIAFLGSLGSFGNVYGLGMMSGFAALGMVAGIIEIAIGILVFFVGKGLWNGKNWARITALVFAILGILQGLATLIIGVGIISLIISGLILWYLGFNKDAKKYFKAKGFFS